MTFDERRKDAGAGGSTGSDAPPAPGRVTLTLAVHGVAVRRARAGRARPDGNRSLTDGGRPVWNRGQAPLGPVPDLSACITS